MPTAAAPQPDGKRGRGLDVGLAARAYATASGSTSSSTLHNHHPHLQPRGRRVVPRVLGLRLAAAKRKLRQRDCGVGFAGFTPGESAG